MDVRLPDGTIIQGVPDGTTKADLVAKLQRNGMAVPSEWLDAKPPQPEPSISEQAGAALRQIPRQAGLFVRSTLEGAPAILDTLASPFRAGIELATGRRLSTASGEGGLASRVADLIGLPTAQTPNERTVAEGVRGGMSAASGAGVAQAGTRLLTSAAGTAPTVAGNVLQALAANPGTQVAAGTSGGLAGGSVREAGGGAGEQFVASLAGGIAGGAAANKAAGAADAIKRAVTPRSVLTQQADQQISLVLERQGIDWRQVPESVRAPMRDEAAQALATGGTLDPAALRRLLVFQRTGTTPTVGMLTQNPGQITRERNLSKTGANSTDRNLQRLPALENDNAAALLRNLDEAGAAGAPGAFDAGQKAVDSLGTTVARKEGELSGLYSQARDSAGRSLPLNAGAFNQRVNSLLDDANVGSFLPADIRNKINKIAMSEPGYPLTVDSREQLKTSIASLRRNSADGNARHALKLVRQALDETPLLDDLPANPGNLPALPGQVAQANAGREAVDAYNTARSEYAAWMRRVEGNPALKAVTEGVQPDQFLQKFVLGKGASAADVQALRSELDPQALQSIKGYLVRYLRDAATGGDTDITKFGGAAYRRALRDIGEAKLAAFFDADELRRLQDVGAAAKYMQSQPAGSAVNNSNSGALMLGRGLDMLEGIANKLPLGGRDVLQGMIQGRQQTQVLSPRNALAVAADPAARGPRLNPLLAAAVSAPVPARADERGKR